MPRKFFLRFPQEILGEPVLYNLGRKYEVVPNIRGASISSEQALMAVELEGEEAVIEEAVVWLRTKGVEVEVLSPDEHPRL